MPTNPITAPLPSGVSFHPSLEKELLDDERWRLRMTVERRSRTASHVQSGVWLFVLFVGITISKSLWMVAAASFGGMFVGYFFESLIQRHWIKPLMDKEHELLLQSMKIS